MQIFQVTTVQKKALLAMERKPEWQEESRGAILAWLVPTIL
jgi:hypothetical protein